MLVQVQLLMLSPNLLKIQVHYMEGSGGPTCDAESKSAKNPNSLDGGGEVGLGPDGVYPIHPIQF